MKGRIEKRDITLLIWGIYPSFEFIVEGSGPRVQSIPMMGFRELFKMLYEYFHAGKIILEGCKMEQSAVTLIKKN